MKNKMKSVVICLMLLAVVGLLCACGQSQTQYDVNDADGYTVSVKFDANGGEFTTNCSVIVDSFNISGMSKNADGMVELALIAPDNGLRGQSDTFTAARNGYFMAGWYQTRTEVVDAEGNTTYTYADKWDFEVDRLTVDPSKSYTSAEPELVLYAAWVPMYEVRFYAMGETEPYGTYTYNPTNVDSLNIPQWNEETGTVDMYKFPKQSGCTFDGAYRYVDGEYQLIEEASIALPTEVDFTAGAQIVDIYVDWLDGEWFRIYTAEQLNKNATRNGCYELCADLDFTGVDWPAVFMNNEFNGTVQGNGYTISNVTIVQTDNSKARFGLFGGLSATAGIYDVTFNNVTATIRSGARTSGIAYGLFAGSIATDAKVEGVKILDSQLQIDSGCMLTSNDYVFGLICGMGNFNAVEYAEIVAVAVGDHPESVTITVDETDGTLTVVIE